MNPETTEAPETPVDIPAAQEPTPTQTTEPPVDDPVVLAEEMRQFLKTGEDMARRYAECVKGPFCLPMHDKGEVIAQCMLALRHIEDARMRYGKCIQYATTGESSYQK